MGTRRAGTLVCGGNVLRANNTITNHVAGIGFVRTQRKARGVLPTGILATRERRSGVRPLWHPAVRGTPR